MKENGVQTCCLVCFILTQPHAVLTNLLDVFIQQLLCFCLDIAYLSVCLFVCLSVCLWRLSNFCLSLCVCVCLDLFSCFLSVSSAGVSIHKHTQTTHTHTHTQTTHTNTKGEVEQFYFFVDFLVHCLLELFVVGVDHLLLFL